MRTKARQVCDIATLLSNHSNVALHGCTGIGKTWIIGRVAAQLRQAGGYMVLRQDLSTLDSGAQAFSEMHAQLQFHSGSPSPLLGEDLHASWAAVVEAARRAPVPVIWLLDNLDDVARFADAGDYLRHVRGLIQGDRTEGCTALLASRRPIPIIEREIRGISTIAGVCYTEYVRPVQAEEVALLWDVDDLDESDLREARQWAGGLPVLVNAWLALRPSASDSGWEMGGVQRREALTKQLDYLERLELLDCAAQEVLGPVVSVDGRSRATLRALGVIPYTGRSSVDEYGVLGDWDEFAEQLRLRTQDLDAWGVFGAAERLTRQIVEVLLAAAYGLTWEEVVARKHESLGKCIADARTLQQRDAKRYGAGMSLLSYTYPGDLWAIINAEWETFRHVFKSGEKRQWKERFDGLASLRAPLAHNREEVLSGSTKLQLKVWSEEIIRAIEDFESSMDHAIAQSAKA